MKPTALKTKIFLDSGDPEETRQAIALLGFLDGQTTNPSLIAKNPQTAGKKFTLESIYDFYKGVVAEVSALIPEGSVSVEVYADASTGAQEMLEQGKRMFAWIPNAHIKYPTTTAGLSAAEESIKAGMRVNLTLCFSQSQAAAVYAATQGAKKGGVFVSPFVGRLDDIGQNGMQFIANAIKMYRQGDGHVEVLTASVRSLEHFLYALALGSDIITAPLKVIKQWAEVGMSVPGADYQYQSGSFSPIAYERINLDQPWQAFNLHHDLTDRGIERFAADWNALISN